MGAGTPLSRSTKSLKLRGDVPIRYIALTMYYSPLSAKYTDGLAFKPDHASIRPPRPRSCFPAHPQ
jgi:hypothetical protein